MRRFFVAFLAITLAYSPFVEARETRASTPSAQAQPNEVDLQSHKHYTNKNGHEVHSPSTAKSDTAPQGATARCRDSTYSFSANHRGTCSHHGGVSKW